LLSNCLLLAGVLFLSPIVYSQNFTSGSGLHILDQRKVYFGSHSVTLNRVTTPVFAAPVPTPAPAAPPSQPFANYELLLLGATVYDGQFSVLERIDGDQGFVAVSNVDFDYFSIEGFGGGDTFYELIMALDNESSSGADPTTAGWLAQARSALSGSVPGYMIVSGTASTDDLQALDALHAYFGANASSLEQQYQQRQAQYAAKLLQLKLHPPVRPNTVINYWPIKSSVYVTGSSR